MLRRCSVLLLALVTACGGQDCTLAGCVSALRLALPDGVQSARACVGELCVEEVVDGALSVPLSRRLDATEVDVVVEVVAADGTATTVRGSVPVSRSTPEAQDEDCPTECVNGEAAVDVDRGALVAQE